MNNKTKKIKEMQGKTWQNKSTEEIYKFLSIEENGQNLIITTDKEDLRTTHFDIAVFMDQYKEIVPVGHEMIHTNANENTRRDNMPQISTMDKSTMHKMRDKLMASLDKIDEDPGYIPQAHAISNTCNTLINLAKIEIDLRTKL